MKRVFVDVGTIYTKVLVWNELSKECVGKLCFPTVAEKARDTNENVIYYEQEGVYYYVGYDCPGLTWQVRGIGEAAQMAVGVDQPANRGEGEPASWAAANAGRLNARYLCLVLQKVLFDFGSTDDALELNIIIDSVESLSALKAAVRDLEKGVVLCGAWRGLDQKQIEKTLNVSIVFRFSADAIAGYLSRAKPGFDSALVVDIGYKTTKVYLLTRDKGVDLFRCVEQGIRCYYDKILGLLAEEGVSQVNFFWLIKQMEAGSQEIEVVAHDNKVEKDFDCSLVMTDVRWELNKQIRLVVADVLTAYYTNTIQWVDTFLIMGGGAALNGEILATSLYEGGMRFEDVFVEKNGVYKLVEGLVGLSVEV